MTTLIEREFPDFDLATLPSIPEGFVDQSWHNDVCPCFVDEARHLALWIDFAHEHERETPGHARFILCRTDEGGTGGLEIAASDDFAAIEAAIAQEG